MSVKEATAENQEAGGLGTALRDRLSAVDPMILAAGAAVAGAAAGALIPRSDTETRVLAPIGAHVTGAVGAVGTSVRQAIAAELAAVPVVGHVSFRSRCQPEWTTAC